MPAIPRFLTDFRPLSALFLSIMAGPPGVGAQEPPWLPKGWVRLGFFPSFWAWDRTYGAGAPAEGATSKGVLLAAPLNTSSLGSSVLPVLKDLEAEISELLGQPEYRVSLGRSRAAVEQSVLSFGWRGEVAVSSRLTLGVTVPFVRPRTEVVFTLLGDSATANVGPSPWVTDAGQVLGFLAAARNAVALAEQAHPGSPVVAAARRYVDGLGRAYLQGTAFPVLGSSAGRTLEELWEGIRNGLAGLGISNLPQRVPLSDRYFDDESFALLLALSPISAAPLDDWTTPWSLGDVELTAAFRLFHGASSPDSAAEAPRLRYQLGIGGLARLPTGKSDDPHRFLDVRPADGQLDLEISVTGMVGAGSRWDLWSQFRYGVQRRGRVLGRIAGPDELLPHRARLAPLYRTPGPYHESVVFPRFKVAPGMHLAARLRSWVQGEDRHELRFRDPQTPDRLNLPPASLLDVGTRQKLREIGVGATFSTIEAFAEGKARFPVFLQAIFVRPLGGTGRFTPQGDRFEARISLSWPLLGHNSGRTIRGETPATGSPAPNPFPPRRQGARGS